MYNGSFEDFKYICSTRDNANIDFSHHKTKGKNIITLENCMSCCTNNKT